MRESICVDWDWEAYVADRTPRTEDEWWEAACARSDREREAELELEAFAYDLADEIEFDSVEERKAFIARYIEKGLKEISA